MKDAYLLVYHGSRARRSTVSVAQLANLVQEKLSESGYSDENLTPSQITPKVGIAALEFDHLPLSESIQVFAREAKSLGYESVKVVPLFLLPGVHAQEDIPQSVSDARACLGDLIKIDLLSYIGSSPGLIEVLKVKFTVFPNYAKVLLSHGSKKQGGNLPLEAIASTLSAKLAYWSISPSLSEMVVSLVNAGEKSIAIVPYFLFPGHITDEIAQQVKQLESDFPFVKFYLSDVLGSTPQLASLIIEN